MITMRAIVVEDEEPARQLIHSYLTGIDDIQIIGEYADGYSGAIAINRDKPDLVFLDIQLPRIDGFELLELIDCKPQIVFTTAYDQHAIEAFERNATDYLLKPFSRERFLKALDKVREQYQIRAGRQHDSQAPDISSLSDAVPLNRIVIKDSKGIHVVPLDAVSYFEAQGDYVMIYTANGRYMKKQTLKVLENRLNTNTFIRVHRSYIVNTGAIQKIERYEKGSYLALLKGNIWIKISETGYKKLRESLDF